MKHQLKISVSKHQQTDGIIHCRNVTIREKILRYLLGEKQRLIIIILGDIVEQLSINEIETVDVEDD